MDRLSLQFPSVLCCSVKLIHREFLVCGFVVYYPSLAALGSAVTGSTFCWRGPGHVGPSSSSYHICLFVAMLGTEKGGQENRRLELGQGWPLPLSCSLLIVLDLETPRRMCVNWANFLSCGSMKLFLLNIFDIKKYVCVM